MLVGLRLTELIHSVGSLKAFFEEEREENRRRFEQIDKRFEQMDKRFDDVMTEVKDVRKDQHYMSGRIFQTEMDIQRVKDAYFQR